MRFKPELEMVREMIEGTTVPNCDLGREVSSYVYQGQGKFLRPRLVILSSRVPKPFSREPLPEDRAALRVAASMEILHTASLVHDDVVDKASTRRGRPSVNARYGDDVAILVADSLFAQ
ncbi:polyprenyl synthetase family protein, partial [bacterium]|nr:polyprenyl synthetase family protein [bacterium]